MIDRWTIDALNQASPDAFCQALGPVFEQAGWVAAEAAAARPFASAAALHAAMMAAVARAPSEQRRAFICGHPDLAGKAARAGAITAESRAEQGGLGLDRLSDAAFARFERLNQAYRERFGFPFIVCVRRQTRDAILRAFEQRLGHDAAAEEATALAEIGHITRLRLADRVTSDGSLKTTGRLSTHVLDNFSGQPAAGVALRLYEIGEDAESLLVDTVTNADGRTDAPLIGGTPLRVGTYELRFALGDYFRAQAARLADPPFLDRVPVRFAIAEPEGHYHVPLLASPWSYTTYRGS